MPASWPCCICCSMACCCCARDMPSWPEGSSSGCSGRPSDVSATARGGRPCCCGGGSPPWCGLGGGRKPPPSAVCMPGAIPHASASFAQTELTASVMDGPGPLSESRRQPGTTSSRGSSSAMPVSRSALSPPPLRPTTLPTTSLDSSTRMCTGHGLPSTAEPSLRHRRWMHRSCEATGGRMVMSRPPSQSPRASSNWAPLSSRISRSPDPALPTR
mmetsp:Transcript_6860/g.21912  ORF Transcript_6860/g.21912 Transcript_6860/m.21912 type:complete len:215 (-) Transcript_6860:482-1126(-)